MSRFVVVSVFVFSLFLSAPGLTQPIPTATPESVGFSPDRLARVDQLFESYISDNRMAGVVVAIARKGKLVHFRSLGRMDMDEEQPMREDAIFRMASIYRVNDESETEELWSGLQSEESRPPKAPNGAGGLFSTANDYLRFAQMLLNRGELDGVRLLGRKTVELMTTDQLPLGVSLPEQFGAPRYRLGGYGFGLGVRVRTDIAESQMLGSLGEYGWGGAFGTYFLVDPEEELLALFLPQLRGTHQHPIRRQFNNAVYQALVD